MTKIFEALENAGFERHHQREANEMPAPPLPEQQITPAHYSRTALRPSKWKGIDTASSLYQSVVTLLPGMESRIIQFLGPQEGEGTSTMVRELASIAAMKLKKNVLILDLNQKPPNQSSYFNVRSSLPPLDASYQAKLTKNDFARIDDSTLYVTQLPADGIPAGIVCEMPQISLMLDDLKKEFDLIIIDSPSAFSCAECLLVSPKVDGVILVVQAEKTRWQTVNKVKESIFAQNGNILGVVLNKRRFPIPEFIYKRI